MHLANLLRSLAPFFSRELWTTEPTEHPHGGKKSKSSWMFCRSWRTKLADKVYRFSHIWYFSSVKTRRKSDGTVAFLNKEVVSS
jgi:hypothetical protein